jgi:hypothetical protein
VADANQSLGNQTTTKPEQNQPNTFLLCVILTLGTFFIANYLRRFRNSHLLGRMARRAIGDFGIPIAIIIMTLLDYLIKDVYTQVRLVVALRTVGRRGGPMRNLIIDGAAGGETKRCCDVTFPLLTLHRGKDRVYFSTGFFQKDNIVYTSVLQIFRTKNR